MTYFITDRCIQCGKCVLECPEGAIEGIEKACVNCAWDGNGWECGLGVTRPNWYEEDGFWCVKWKESELGK